MFKKNSLFIVSFAFALSACQQADRYSASFDKEQIDAAAVQIDEAEFMEHVKTLASDEFGGRAPATPGGAKTVAYLEKAFADAGLKPAFGDSYRQAVGLQELQITNTPPLSVIHYDDTKSELAYKDDSIVFTSRTAEVSQIADSPLVFVGYGVVAPEYDWNDYAGIDMAGKTAVILVNDPGYRNPDGDKFKGRAMTYYGRWTYKFEEAAKQGAAGAIVIHQEDAAGYPWEVVSGSWSGAQYQLFSADGNKDRLSVEAWMTSDAAQELLMKNGMDLFALVERAGMPGFRPIELGSSASARLEVVSRSSDSHNVAGMIEGASRPDEAFLYTAHWDHIGTKDLGEGKDGIYNGAQDNATGTTALIEIAQAFNALPAAPERSVVFLAVTAEESGLLGSQAYAENPPIAMNKTVGGINMDGMSTAGATDDVVVVGYGNSQMDDYLRTVSAEQNREVVLEPTPEKGFFYRSDHFNLAKKGVPMLYAGAGTQVRGKEEGYGKNHAADYTKNRYHKPSDEIFPGWDNGGIMQDMHAMFRIGLMISDSSDWPEWTEGNEFAGIRAASLEASD